MQVPEGWLEKPIKDIVEKIIDYRGQSVPKASQGVPLITARNVRKGYLSFDTMEYIELSEFENWMTRGMPKAGDILFTTEAPLGNVCRYPEEGLYAVAQRTVTLRTKAKVLNSEYLLYFLLSERGQRLIDIRSSGSTAKGIKSSELKKIKVVFPSDLAEQTKIAEILSTWDKAITTTEQLLANSQQQKKALMQQLLTGKKRLLDDNGQRFSGEWRFLTFDEAFKVANKKSAQVKSSDYFATGSVPVVDQGKELIAGYCDNDERYTNVPVIIFGDHTRCLKWVDFEFCPGADGTQVLDSKEFLDKKFGYYLLCHTDIPNLGYSRHMRELKEKDFKVPVDMVEQQKIAAVLSSADQEIDQRLRT